MTDPDDSQGIGNIRGVQEQGDQEQGAQSIPSAPGGSQSTLSPAQTAAVRRYMLTLVAIPGALLTVISALTGYVVGQHEDAAITQQVTNLTLPLITEAAKQTGFSNGEAKSAASQVAAILDDTKAKSAAVTSSIQQLNDAVSKSQAEAKANFTTFAKDLVGDQGFRDALGTAYKSDLSSFKQSLLRWGAEPKRGEKDSIVSGPPGGGKNIASNCPDGMYVIGIETSSNTAPPYCLGCLVNLRAICRSINTQ